MRSFLAAIAVALSLLCVSGCQKKMCTEVIKLHKPVWKARAEIRGAMRPQPAQPVEGTGKLYIYGSWLFLNEPLKGIHVFDNTNPANPVNKAFIPVPGNVDLAVRGNYLYADSWSDLVVFDISDPANIHPVNFADNLFPTFYNYSMGTGGDTLFLAGYIDRDTVVNCSDVWEEDRSVAMPVYTGISTSAASPGGAGGSMARFALVDDRLYTVNSFQLSVFNISDPAALQRVTTQVIGGRIETIYPLGSTLFIGTATGMLIYDISAPNTPRYLSRFDHATACDPVIADGQHAYVTLRSGTNCNTINNELNVVNIASLTTPQLVRTYPMTNPHGLSKDGNLLFICDGRDGIRMLDASNPASLMPLHQVTGIDTYDAIANNGILIVSAKDGLYQYDYRSGNRLQRLSRIPVGQ